jgi:hypothetical protein
VQVRDFGLAMPIARGGSGFHNIHEARVEVLISASTRAFLMAPMATGFGAVFSVTWVINDTEPGANS